MPRDANLKYRFWFESVKAAAPFLSAGFTANDNMQDGGSNNKAMVSCVIARNIRMAVATTKQ